VINSNLGPILHRYWDTATYRPKIANFAHPFVIAAGNWTMQKPYYFPCHGP